MIMDTSNTKPCELIIVNNCPKKPLNSVFDFVNTGIETRIIEEPITGLSHAKNCGIHNSRGEWLAFIDDDVIIHPQWLQAVTKGIANYPEASFFGGRIIGDFQGIAPSWYHYNQIPDWLFGVLGNYDLGEGDYIFDPETMDEFFGANLIFEKSLLQKYGVFDIELGVAANREQRTGEETELLRRICAKNTTGYYLGKASVQHISPASRLTSDYIYSYFQACGRSCAMIDTKIMLSQASSSSFLNHIYTKVGYLQFLCFELLGIQNRKAEEEILKFNSYIINTKSYLIELLTNRLDFHPDESTLFYSRALQILSTQIFTEQHCIRLKAITQARCEQKSISEESDHQFIKNRLTGQLAYLGKLLVELKQSRHLSKERETLRLQSSLAELLRIRLESDKTLELRFYKSLLKNFESAIFNQHRCCTAQGRVFAKQYEDEINQLSNSSFKKLVLNPGKRMSKKNVCSNDDEIVMNHWEIARSRGFLKEALKMRLEKKGFSINLLLCYLIAVKIFLQFAINTKKLFALK